MLAVKIKVLSGFFFPKQLHDVLIKALKFVSKLNKVFSRLHLLKLVIDLKLTYPSLLITKPFGNIILT